MKKLPHVFFFLLYSIINSFLFKSQYFCRQFLPHFSLLPLFSSLSQSVPSSSLHPQTEERRRTAPNGPIPAVFSGRGDGKGWRRVGKCLLFISLRSKEFKRCPSLSVLLGAEVWAGTRVTPSSGRPRCGLAHRHGDKSLLC